MRTFFFNQIFYFPFLLFDFLTDDSGDDFPSSSPRITQGGGSQNSEVQSALRTLSNKVEDLSTCNDLISKHGSALQRSDLNPFCLALCFNLQATVSFMPHVSTSLLCEL